MLDHPPYDNKEMISVMKKTWQEGKPGLLLYVDEYKQKGISVRCCQINSNTTKWIRRCG